MMKSAPMDTLVATRRRWPRIVLTLPPEAAADLSRLAAEHYRDPRREALRLVLDGIARETADRGAAR